MKTTMTKVISLRECIAKTRGPVPQSTSSLELGKVGVPINMYQTKSSLVIKAFLPGVKSGDINISIKQDIIRIYGEHKEKSGMQEDDYFCQEHNFGSFDRELTIPIPVQSDKIEMHFRDGILTVTLPKAGGGRHEMSRTKARRTIKTAGGAISSSRLKRNKN
jgi:HSP20 family protein